MSHAPKFTLLLCAAISLVVSCSTAQPPESSTPALQLPTLASPGGFTVSVNPATGDYAISAPVAPLPNSPVPASPPAWSFAGSFKTPVSNLSSSTAADRVGPYDQISFHLAANGFPLTAAIRAYQGKTIALFSLTYDAPSPSPAVPFPDFTTIPQRLYPFSYKQIVFSPPVFHPVQDATPWMLFDDAKNAAVISPADHFFINTLAGDAKSRVASTLRPALANIPAGFTQKTLIALAPGINRAWNLWGHALTDLQNKDRPANDADTGLKYLGYWTDNGAFYYYKYDPKKGYAATLLSLAQHFRKSNIPVRYMQLDSWWYSKTLVGPDGVLGKPKNPKLPIGEWNRYGGLLQYRAHPFLFPNGLADFQQQLDLPLITHNRWIDPSSPYHQKYKISGYAGVDPAYWQDIASYIKSSGAVCYEQDWLNIIFQHSPLLASTPDLADAFLDGMANACRDNGLSMQYCMELPCQFLQGSRYPNLTTIRCSNDRFNRDRWHDFLFTSRLAAAEGIWPWTDVCLSTETNNLLLSTLSAGMVGFGDEMNKESPSSLLRAARADGVIVKPDAPILPLDDNYVTIAAPLAAAAARPFITGRPWPLPPVAPIVSSTFTDHAGHRTAYVFAFNDLHAPTTTFHFSPANDLDIHGPAVVYEYFTGKITPIPDAADFNATLAADNTWYAQIVPVGPSQIAFLGDPDKFVSTGKQRIASIDDQPGRLSVAVTLSPSERNVSLHGIAKAPPTVSADIGSPGPVDFDPANGHFLVMIKIPDDAPVDQTPADPVRTVTVTFSTK